MKKRINIQLTFIFLGIVLISVIRYTISHTIPSKLEKSNMNSLVTTHMFVYAKDRNLYLSNQIFHSVGVNRYNLLSKNESSEEVGCANSFSENDIDKMFSELHALGVTSVRFWLFQSFTKSGDDLSRFNYVIHAAQTYKIKLIPVFENHWNDCTQGGTKDSLWYASSYREAYGNYPVSLKEYIEKIVPLYKDNPTIMMWQIMNEAEDADSTDLYLFARDISHYIKTIDANHLISLGSNSIQTSEEYKKIYSLPSIDVIDYHDYDSTMLPVNLSDRFQVSVTVDKPLLVDEAGIKNTVMDRGKIIESKMNAFFKNGGAAYLIWSYGNSSVTNDGYNFEFSDPIAQVIKAQAANF